ncbi:MAG: PA0069 family radical SAM protein [Planctomycetota bacterium]|nr:MAG: PA0069 family radical SAM protein [Planctomycetota bacterium]
MPRARRSLPLATGRGLLESPPSRFAGLRYEAAGDGTEDEGAGPSTEVVFERARTILSFNQSPDLPFAASLNPYRGCEHGCAYCYARPSHEYLGLSAGLDFETRIVAKENAPELLRCALAKPSWTPQPIALSGNTDCYQPVERRLELTRRCLQVLAEFRNPVAVVTKSHLVTRDLDLLGELAAEGAASVSLSLTTLDAALAADLEPRAARPERRLAALRSLAAAGVPTGVLVAPVVPGLNDHELPHLLEAAAAAGARHAQWLLLRLPHGVSELFSAWLERRRPQRAAKVLAQIRCTRGGALHDARFGRRQRGEGARAAAIASLFELWRRRLGLSAEPPQLSTAAFRRPGAQLRLF